ncbi:Cyclin-dependent kinase 2 [Entamoeba marina]
MDQHPLIIDKRSKKPKMNTIVNHRYEKEVKLGEGTYGVVSKVKMEHDEEGVPSTALREIAVLRELKHPNVVELLDVYNSDKKLYLIFEYCETDLHKYLQVNPQQLPLSIIRSFTYQILLALSFLHSRRILHRDIKPSNILVSGNEVKLGDFGLARSIGIPIKKYTPEVVTIWYRSPELLLKTSTYSSAIDIWATGAVCAEMVTREPLFKGDSELDQIHKVFNLMGVPTKEEMESINYLHKNNLFDSGCKQEDTLENRLRYMGPNGIDLLKQMFDYCPGKRICARDSLLHPFFKEN